ncbi:MAG: hypothetical protein LBT12_08785 [Oscillospiraceae bacterium]|nr:hypothetical protein [Oscillospiraceae bacterium]
MFTFSICKGIPSATGGSVGSGSGSGVGVGCVGGIYGGGGGAGAVYESPSASVCPLTVMSPPLLFMTVAPLLRGVRPVAAVRRRTTAPSAVEPASALAHCTAPRSPVKGSRSAPLRALDGRLAARCSLAAA